MNAHNLHTEDGAAEKWCPFSRATYVTGTFNRAVFGKGDTSASKSSVSCIGSECMAWRWSDDTLRTGHCGVANSGL